MGVTAASTAPMFYDVFDHDERGIGSKDNGLRLDCLNPDTFWSFVDGSDNSRVELLVDIDAGTGSVDGTMRQNDCAADCDWILELTLNNVVSLSSIGAGENSFGALTWSGTLTQVGGAMTNYDLMGKGKDVGGTEYQWTYFETNPGGGADFRPPNISAGWVKSVNGRNLDDTNDFIGQMVSGTPPPGVVPVPATLPLLLAGLGGLGYMARRRRKT